MPSSFIKTDHLQGHKEYNFYDCAVNIRLMNYPYDLKGGNLNNFEIFETCY